MPVIQSPPAMPPAGNPPPRKKWTRDECRRLVALGLLPEGSHYELIEGDIVEKAGQNVPHVFVLLHLFHALVAVFGAEFVQSQALIALSDNTEPEPDAFVTLYPLRHYLQSGTPSAADIRLVPEVSDSALSFDTTTKAQLYARAGIPEYWVVDVNARRLLVFRHPTPTGYASQESARETETVSPLAAPTARIQFSELLP